MLLTHDRAAELAATRLRAAVHAAAGFSELLGEAFKVGRTTSCGRCS
jgi:hypothetical protein